MNTPNNSESTQGRGVRRELITPITSHSIGELKVVNARADCLIEETELHRNDKYLVTKPKVVNTDAARARAR
jgi:hypothetical protein